VEILLFFFSIVCNALTQIAETNNVGIGLQIVLFRVIFVPLWWW